MKKKFLILICAVFAVGMVLTACVKNDVSNATTQKTQTEETSAANVTETSQDDVYSEGGVVGAIVVPDTIKLTYVEGGEPTDTSLVFFKSVKFVEFAKATEVLENARVEKRSDSNVVIYVNEGTAFEYNVQYSTGSGSYSDDTVRTVMYPNGYEVLTLDDGSEALYTFEEEENGTRAIIMQPIGDDYYVSIRSFNKIGMNNMEYVKMILINENYPIHSAIVEE